MTCKLFLDSVPFVAILKADDAYKEESGKLLDAIRKRKAAAYCSAISLAECAYVMRKLGMPRKNTGESLRLLQSLKNIGFLPVTAEIITDAAEYGGEYGLDLSDGIIVATMVRHGCKTLVTEDEHFGKVPFIETIGIKKAKELLA